MLIWDQVSPKQWNNHQNKKVIKHNNELLGANFILYAVENERE
jgi:hypothetical protein